VVFKGAGFLIIDSPFPLAGSDPYYFGERRVPHERKTRTLHKDREECGTRKSNPTQPKAWPNYRHNV